MKKHIALTGYGAGQSTTVDALSGNLAELLGSLLQDGRSLIALAEFADHRYIQFYVSLDGYVIGEVISNLNIGTMTALQPEAEEALRALGFTEPEFGPNPNWWIKATNNAEVLALVTTMQRVVYDVLNETGSNVVTVSTWQAKMPAGWGDDDFREEFRVYVQDESEDNNE
jgi:hypothetical protein